ncbi:hypothetical protein NL676_009284 [Syzygium grande]|nr:hypothetical protein NL676_009284 [Syzygium grande]
MCRARTVMAHGSCHATVLHHQPGIPPPPLPGAGPPPGPQLPCSDDTCECMLDRILQISNATCSRSTFGAM